MCSESFGIKDAHYLGLSTRIYVSPQQTKIRRKQLLGSFPCHSSFTTCLDTIYMSGRSKRIVLQVFLKLDRADQEKLGKQSSAMELAKNMVNKSLGDFSGGQLRQEQQAAVMHLYRLTAEVKVWILKGATTAHSLAIEGVCNGQIQSSYHLC